MRIPIYILTGFLGSGKTTLLNRCLSDPGFADSAVLINEFGEIGLDHLLVQSVDEEVVILESGCVCCNMRDDFTSALLDLARRRDRAQTPLFQRVVMETSGIADPNALHQLLLSDPEISKRYRHAGTITVVDGVFGLGTLDRQPEAVVQIAVADRLIVSKADIASTQQIQLLWDRLAGLSPEAALRSDRECGDLASLLDALEDGPPTLPRVVQHGIETRAFSDAHGDRFRTFRVTRSAALAWEDLTAWLEALLFARGDDIYRIKGWANIDGESQPVVVQSVQHALYAPQKLDAWPQDERRTDLTFICINFTQAAAMTSLRQACDWEAHVMIRPDSKQGMTDVSDAIPAVCTVEVPGIEAFLTRQLQRIEASARRRPWHTWSLHNPWSLASTIVDSWELLGKCQSPEILDAVGELIGEDIVLYENQLLPIAFASASDHAWQNDAAMYPVSPAAGVVVRLPLKAMAGVRFCARRSGNEHTLISRVYRPTHRA